MEKSFGCFFYLKKKGKSLSEELPVYIRITVDYDSIHISTKRKCFKANWNVKAGKAEGRTDYAKALTLISILFNKKFLKPNEVIRHSRMHKVLKLVTKN